jgi:hypothetical protein
LLDELSLQRQLERAHALIAEQNRTIDELRTAFSDAQDRRELASVELEAARRRIHELSTERDSLRAARDRLALTSTDLHSRRDDVRLAKLRIASLQTDLATQAELLQQREGELAAAQHALVTLRALAPRSEPVAAPPFEPGDTLSRIEKTVIQRLPPKLTDAVLPKSPSKSARVSVQPAPNTEFMETVAESALSGQTERVLVPINHDGDVIVLDRPTMTIGRTRANDVRIKSKAISRHHATLVIGPDSITVEDAGSTNGCMVNGQKITQSQMRDGDCLELGDLQYRLATRHVQSNVASSADALSQARIMQVSPAALSDIARLEADPLPSG